LSNKEIDLQAEAQKREKQMKALKNFRLLDDIFMRVALEDKDCVKCVLDTILDANLTILESKTQVSITNLHGGSVYLDVLSLDDKGEICNIEVQRADEGARPKRARRNSSFLDANHPDPGRYGENLRTTYVIFITESDPLGFGLPIYHIDRTIRENGEPFNDGAHIIYVTSKVQDLSTKLGRLMHDFTVKSADEMYNEALANRVKQLKETKEGQEHMCKIMEEMVEEARERGHKIGLEEGLKTGLKAGREETEEQHICLMAKRMSPKTIADLLELSLNRVQDILKNNKITPLEES